MATTSRRAWPRPPGLVRDVEEGGEPADAHERGDAADPADIGLDEVDDAGEQHVPELRLGVQALACRDGTPIAVRSRA